MFQIIKNKFYTTFPKFTNLDKMNFNFYKIDFIKLVINQQNRQKKKFHKKIKKKCSFLNF